MHADEPCSTPDQLEQVLASIRIGSRFITAATERAEPARDAPWVDEPTLFQRAVGSEGSSAGDSTPVAVARTGERYTELAVLGEPGEARPTGRK